LNRERTAARMAMAMKTPGKFLGRATIRSKGQMTAPSP
jgi:hypothetical protein